MLDWYGVHRLKDIVRLWGIWVSLIFPKRSSSAIRVWGSSEQLFSYLNNFRTW